MVAELDTLDNPLHVFFGRRVEKKSYCNRPTTGEKLA